MFSYIKDNNDHRFILDDIKSGHSPGERIFIQQNSKKMQRIKSRIDKLLAEEKIEAKTGTKHVSRPSTPKIHDVFRARAESRRREIQELESLWQLYQEDSRYLPRQRKYEVLNLINVCLPILDSLNENFENLDIMEDKTLIYDSHGRVQNILSMCVALISAGVLRQVLDHHFHSAVGAGLHLFKELQDEEEKKKFIYGFSDQMTMDPDFFLVLLESKRLSTILDPESFFGKIIVKKICDHISGQALLDSMAENNKQILSDLTVKTVALGDLKKSFLKKPSVALGQEVINTQSDLSSVASKLAQVQYATHLVKKQLQVMKKKSQFLGSTQRARNVAQNLYAVLYSLVDGYEKMTATAGNKVYAQNLAQAIAKCFCAQNETMLHRVNTLIELHQEVYKLIPNIKHREKSLSNLPKNTELLQQETNNLDQDLVAITDTKVQILLASVKDKLPDFVYLSLAYSQQFVPEKVPLHVFSNVICEIVLKASEPGRLPNYILVHELLTNLSEKDTHKLFNTILNFCNRHDLSTILQNNAAHISTEAINIWSEFSEHSTHIGFDKQTIIAFQPVLTLLIYYGCAQENFEKFSRMIQCILEMIMLPPADKPSTIILLDYIFSLLAASPELRKSMDKSPEARQGMLKFFRVLFKNNVLIANRVYAATQIQKVYRGHRTRLRLIEAEILPKQNLSVSDPSDYRALSLDDLSPPSKSSLDFSIYGIPNVADFRSIDAQQVPTSELSESSLDSFFTAQDYHSSEMSIGQEDFPSRYQQYVLDTAHSICYSNKTDDLQKTASQVTAGHIVNSSVYGYDRTEDISAPVEKNIGVFERMQRWFVGLFLQYMMVKPERLLGMLRDLSQHSSQKGSWLSMTAYLRYFLNLDDSTRSLLARLADAIDLIIRSNPLFWTQLSQNDQNYEALYRLIKVLINPKIPNNSPVAIDAIGKLFETVQDYAVVRPETYSAVQALLSIWIDPEIFSQRCQEAELSIKNRTRQTLAKAKEGDNLSMSLSSSSPVPRSHLHKTMRKRKRGLNKPSRSMRSKSFSLD